MTKSVEIRMKRPSHPGAFVRLIVLDPLGFSMTEAEKALGVTRPALLNQRASLSPEMAIHMEKAFDVDMETLMRMQTAHDVAQARKRQGEIKVARYVAEATNG